MVRIPVHRLLCLFILLPAVFLYAEMQQEEIEKAYYESYTLEKQQNYLTAMRALQPVLSAYPTGYTINFRMGWLSYCNGNYADALQYYKKALVTYPASIEVLQCISLTYVAKQDWAKVEEENYKIIKIDYFNQKGNYWYAYALKMRKKYDVAENICRKMLVIVPTSVSFLQELAEVLYLKGKYDESLSLFLSVKVLDPYNESAKKYIPMLKPDKEKEQ